MFARYNISRLGRNLAAANRMTSRPSSGTPPKTSMTESETAAAQSAAAAAVGVDVYEGDLPDLDEAKEVLSGFGGQGNVELMFDNDTGVGRLVIDNPAKKNALTGKMIVEFSEAVDQLETWREGKGLLVTGSASGRCFCSGGDLAFVRESASPRMGFLMSRIMTDALVRLRALPVISAAYIQGAGALGGGAEIAAACDFRLIAADSRIGFVHTRLGIVPAWGGVSYLAAALGTARALELVATGRLLEAPEAVQWGLASAVVATEDDALRWIRNVAGFAPDVVRAAKASVNGHRDVEHQGRIFAALFGSKANREALAKNLKHRE